MVILNNDEPKGLVTLYINGVFEETDWAGVKSRPKFIELFDISGKKLDRIIGQYHVSERIRCGLKQCRALHNKGFVVTTSNGYETNIGKDCGKNKFNVDFKAESKNFQSLVADNKNREILNKFLAYLDSFKGEIETLKNKEHGATWVLKKINPLVTKDRGCPEIVVNTLTTMARAEKHMVIKHRTATKEEREIQQAMSGKSVSSDYQYEEVIGSLNGMEVLYSKNNLHQILMMQLDKELQKFDGLDPSVLSGNILVQLVKSKDDCIQWLERANYLVEKARELLCYDNLIILKELIETQEDMADFSRYMDTISD